jgi:hypothetical protein
MSSEVRQDANIKSRVCELFSLELEKAKVNGQKRLDNGLLAKIVADQEKEHGLSEGTIKIDSVKSGNFSGTHAARTPILDKIEPEIIDYFVRLVNIGQQLSQEQVLLVANQLVKLHNLVDKIIEFK